MTVVLDHTIVRSRDKAAAARYLADALELEVGPAAGPFLPVRTGNGVTLDFMDVGPADPWAQQHLAFGVTDAHFDRLLDRLRRSGQDFWADPFHKVLNEENHDHGGRGLYFLDPDGHNLEVQTVPDGACRLVEATVRRVYSSGVIIREAEEDDLPDIVAMYADDVLGSTRESAQEPLDLGYVAAFRQIQADPRHRLVVAEDDAGVVGTLQLSFIPHVVLRGGERAQIEAVRVSARARGGGLGHALVEWAVETARERGCRLVQLTTNASRGDAHRFYEGLGFEPSHVGMKRMLHVP